jgi:HD-like signal output (HDOD) protein
MTSPSEPSGKVHSHRAASTQPALLNANDLYRIKEFHIYQEAIERMQTHEDQLPSLPTITLEIRKATANPNVNTDQLSKLIAKDPSLTVILIKHASSVYYRSIDKPKNLNDVINRLGMRTVENLTLAHSIRSLFVLRDHHFKDLYKHAWQRQTLKACMSYHIAKSLRFPAAEDAMIASLLSEVGTLTLLVALQNHDVPAESTYKILCKHYSKHLGAILLAKWGVAPIFSDVLRKTGAWTQDTGTNLQLVDTINLGLFHTIQRLQPQNDLIPLQELTAYKKLLPHYQQLKHNQLALVQDHLQQIQLMAKAFG